jgi:ribosomal-protein-alanine N-acetyltransferase
MDFPRSSAPGLGIPHELTTSRLVLRRLELDDAAFVVRLLNEPSFLENIGDRGVRDEKDAHRYLREGPLAMYAKYGFGLWHASLKSDGTAIGMCGLLQRDSLPDPDIGYAYFPAHWGKGYALEAAEATLRHGAEKFGLRRIIAVVSQHNAGSIRVLEQIGMQFERMHSMDPGKADVRLYGRAL